MSKLDDIVTIIDNYNESFFNYNRDINSVLEQLENLEFLGELDHNNFYMLQIEQVWVYTVDGKRVLHTLSSEEREELYNTSKLEMFPKFEIANALHWYVSLKENYVQVILSTNYEDEFEIKIESPKDAYGRIYEQTMKPNSTFEKTDFVVTSLEENNVKDTFGKIIKIAKQSTSSFMPPDFAEVVQKNMSFYWGNKKHNERLVDDIHQETDMPEIIVLPQEFTKIDLRLDKKFFNLVHGLSYDDIDFENCGYIKHFVNIKDASNYFYSAIDYVNNNHFYIKESQTEQNITQVEKHYFSNKWPIATTQEESERYNKELTKFTVSVTKVKDEIILKLDVWEHGLVYIITNHWDRKILEKD